jgi:hydroxylamine dehydrogenase
MQRTCLACHGTAWVTQHFERLDNTIAQTNHNVRTATELMEAIWQKNHARGPADGGSPFDEYIERRWMDTGCFMPTPPALRRPWPAAAITVCSRSAATS